MTTRGRLWADADAHDAERLSFLGELELLAEGERRMEMFEERDGREVGFIPPEDYYADPPLARVFAELHRREVRDES